ncbi:MAG: autotransporter outer membrane beta-barrel domain-containing protein [Pseudomonadota bacterium]
MANTAYNSGGTSTNGGNGGAISLNAETNSAASIDSITGDFIENTASRAGGAIYLYSNTSSTSTITSIKGDFISNSAVYGGAIASFEGVIGSIEGDFIYNTADYGGAITNHIHSNDGGRTSTIESIVGNFIGNSATGAGATSNGGAIRNYVYTYSTNAQTASTVTIGDIIGSFVGNTADGDGGAIYNYAHSESTNSDVVNTAIISSITGDFIGNEAGGSGGAIFNDDNYASIALIGIITGDFICNTAGLYGGAIYNTSQINNINGNFVNNEASGGDVSIGGAIYNYANGEDASIGDITGSFIGNESTGTLGLGGAIANYAGAVDATATIGNITGDFIANSATKYGGAIYNDSNDIKSATIGSITGDFFYNSVIATSSTDGKVQGGAIYNNDTIESIEGSFIGNYVIGSDDNSVAGGAVYTTADMTFTATDQTNYFSDNYIAYYDDNDGSQDDDDKTGVVEYSSGVDLYDIDYNAIYVDVDTIVDGQTEDITLTFTMPGSGNFVMNDSISGNTEYTPLTNTEYTATETSDTVSATASNENKTLTITYSSTTDGKTNSSRTITGTVATTNQIKTTTYTSVDTSYFDSDGEVIASETGGGITVTTTTTTTVTASTSYTDGSAGSTTYSSTISVEGSDGNTTTTTYTEDKTPESGAADSTTTTTTYSITGASDDEGESATYTTVSTDSSAAIVTSAKVVTLNETEDEGAEPTYTTTTYAYNSSGGGTVVVSVADVTTDMTGLTAFNVTITGEKNKVNTFYLNDEITNFGQFKIENAILYLGAYTHTNGDTTTGSLTALDSDSSVTFGEGSQLIIDMSAYEDSISYDASIRTTAVLQGYVADMDDTGDGAKLIIDDSSSLYLVNVSNGATFTILSGFDAIADDSTVTIQGDSTNGYYAWSIDNVTTDSDLYTPIIIRNGYDDTLVKEGDDYTVSTEDVEDVDTYIDNGDVYYVIGFEINTDSPLIHDSPIGDIVYEAASDSAFSHDSDIAGERYLYDVSTMTNDSEELAVAEGTVGLDKVAGVPTVTYRVNRLSSDALGSRLSNLGDTDTVIASYVVNSADDMGSSDSAGDTAYTDNDADGGLGRQSEDYQSVALWFTPMYGHDRTSGASLADYDADFVTNIYGGTVGVDKTIGDGGANILGADAYRMGVAVNMGVGDASSSGDFDGVENDFNFGGVFVYGVAEYGNLTLSVDAGYSKIISEVDQDLSAYGFAGTEAEVRSSAWSIDAHGEYRVETSVVDIVPYAGVEFVSMQTEDYDIKRADAAGGTIFNITSERQNIVSVPVGVKLDREWSSNGWTVRPQLSVGAIFAMGDLDECSLITMPGVAGSGRTQMQVVDEVTFDVSAGMAVMKGNWSLGLDYSVQRSEHRTGHALVGLIQYRF